MKILQINQDDDTERRYIYRDSTWNYVGHKITEEGVLPLEMEGMQPEEAQKDGHDNNRIPKKEKETANIKIIRKS